MYRIYINQTALIITESLPFSLENYQQIEKEGFDFKQFYQHIAHQPTAHNFVLVTTNAKRLFRQIKSSLFFIKAAGGLVKNEEGRFLFIYRKGKWDLPKGKVENKEKTRKAAVREVEEECGIKILSCDDKLAKTYHIYEMGGKVILKKTSWYNMTAHKQHKLIPQLEEDITDARWLAPGDFMLVKQNTYPLIRDLIESLEL
ncbi:MAG TPA: NUDIX domain-containing protein [Daejeonella sp.]|nr:NUDIX domain-containing protein [Daejeonella sp.]